MKVLFIGGTGIISSACSQRAVERGIELFLLNRGTSFRRPPAQATLLRADIRNPESVRAALGSLEFDCVADWVAFTPQHAQTDLTLFRGRTGQYLFISSASAYQTPPERVPVTEETPLSNPVWAYSRDKIACEELLLNAYQSEGFPATIVRPSHTYDATLLPFHGGYTMVDRMRRGQPVVVHGDGTSLWTLTHHADFAVGFLGLLGNPKAVGETFHITSDESLSWNQIYRSVGRAAGAEPRLVHLPSELIAAYDREWGDSLLGDKTHSMVFDNSKIKRFVPEFRASIPFGQGAKEIAAWYEAHPAARIVDPVFDARLEAMVSAYAKAWPGGMMH
jgi:nucleoside-diphosphate-sugar epimerase